MVEETTVTGEVCFVVDALFLAVSWRYLTSMGRKEVFHYVAGVAVGTQRYMLTHLVPIGFAEQSAVGVTADGPSSVAALEQLDQWGARVVGHAHSHPGWGAGATRPSSVDRRFVSDLAAGSYVAIGAICSQDGYFHFYGHEGLQFRVEVVGKEVEEVSENVFKLNNELAAGDLPVAVPRPIASGRGGSSGSAGPADWL